MRAMNIFNTIFDSSLYFEIAGQLQAFVVLSSSGEHSVFYKINIKFKMKTSSRHESLFFFLAGLYFANNNRTLD